MVTNYGKGPGGYTTGGGGGAGVGASEVSPGLQKKVSAMLHEVGAQLNFSNTKGGLNVLLCLEGGRPRSSGNAIFPF